MTNEMLLNAITEMDGGLLEEALCERAKLLSRCEGRVKPLTLKRWGSLAACLILVLTVGLWIRTVFPGGNEQAPRYVSYASMELAESALDRDLPFEVLDSSLMLTRDVSVSFPTESAEDDTSTPLMLKARYEDQHPVYDGSAEAPVTYVDVYVLFNKDSVEDSYISGFDEQGLSKQYGDITVFYSLIEDPMMHGQAKFLYGGDLYVLDVNSTGDTHELMTYLDLLMAGVIGS